MIDFDQLFSFASVTKELCRARLRLADSRHEALFYHQIDRTCISAEEVPIPVTWGEIPVNIFPGRKLWSKFRSKDRSRQSDPNLSTLTRAIDKLSQQTPNADWYIALRDVVHMISTRALSGDVALTTPLVIKEIKDRRKQTYRPLSSFFLVDKIIESLTARYLREALNGALLKSCLAFRPRSDGRHDGLNQILNKLTERAGKAIFIAECDLMGFYDCVSHEVARDSLAMLIREACALDPNLRIDPRAIQVFEAYLKCYSFVRTVKESAEPALIKQNSSATYPWREVELKQLYGERARLDAIGIPQGGAISGLIANAVLHRADKAVQPFCDRCDVTYLRYCDDIIILSPTKSACEGAFQAYCQSVKALKLPIHAPVALRPYIGDQRRMFWTQAKSKAVHRWGSPERRGSFPWMQFLGYQVRYDGLVRVRRSSINKEMEKLARQTDRILRMLTPENAQNLRKSKRSIKHRTRMRLISMAVGSRGLVEIAEPMTKCWSSGFRWLASKNVALGGLKALDRHRERQVNRVARRLATLRISIPPRPGEDPRILNHYGCPFSYWGQFKRKKG